MKKLTRLMSALLCILMLAGVFVSCGNTGNDTETQAKADTTASASVDESTAVVTEYELDDLGELNLGGVINVLAWKDVEHEEFESEGTNGDIINDAIYTRNTTVEKRLGVTINWFREDADSDYVTSWNKFVGTSIATGDHAYDVLAAYSISIALNAYSGYLANMLNEDKFPYLNLDKRWWSDLLQEQATFDGKLYFASGDISRNVLEMMYVCFVNTNIIENHNLENPQELVEKNEWTYAKMIEMCKGIYEGSGVKDELTDTFGYMSNGIHFDPWFYGSGATICQVNADGELVESEDLFSEKMTNIVDMVITLCQSQDGMVGSSAGKHQNAFRDGRLLFCTDRCRCSHKVFAENPDCNFVVVPMPKYDTDQDRYYTVVGNPFTLYAVISDCQDTEKASAFLECMASESYRNVTPAVFEISLKTKYVSDATSGKMYDIVKESVVYDPGRIFNKQFDAQQYFKGAVAKTTNTWASLHASVSKVLANKIKVFNKTMANFDN